ncbi:hypothetical protein ILUMI_18193 [Ignelater luminosus]|uniref:Uncharacterized protein n=1 Tax=Ignelater luminosus TaxID=2038154 RepID=A0A8K0CQQ1_IGNLU|nr:hypothetical protein ILUMI_18193 [Ignelater luminosus]
MAHTFSIHHVAEVVSNAFTARNVCSEFRRKGIFPLNKEVFSEEKFFPALVTDRPNSEQPASESSSAPVNSDSKTHSTPGPHTVGNFQDSDLQRSPEGIRLYPKAEARKERKKR